MQRGHTLTLRIQARAKNPPPVLQKVLYPHCNRTDADRGLVLTQTARLILSVTRCSVLTTAPPGPVTETNDGAQRRRLRRLRLFHTGRRRHARNHSLIAPRTCRPNRLERCHAVVELW